MIIVNPEINYILLSVKYHLTGFTNQILAFISILRLAKKTTIPLVLLISPFDTDFFNRQLQQKASDIINLSKLNKKLKREGYEIQLVDMCDFTFEIEKVTFQNVNYTDFFIKNFYNSENKIFQFNYHQLPFSFNHTTSNNEKIIIHFKIDNQIYEITKSKFDVENSNETSLMLNFDLNYMLSMGKCYFRWFDHSEVNLQNDLEADLYLKTKNSKYFLFAKEYVKKVLVPNICKQNSFKKICISFAHIRLEKENIDFIVQEELKFKDDLQNEKEIVSEKLKWIYLKNFYQMVKNNLNDFHFIYCLSGCPENKLTNETLALAKTFSKNNNIKFVFKNEHLLPTQEREIKALIDFFIVINLFFEKKNHSNWNNHAFIGYFDLQTFRGSSFSYFLYYFLKKPYFLKEMLSLHFDNFTNADYETLLCKMNLFITVF